MSDINNGATSKLINQIYFELHGGDKIKQISKDIDSALKQIQKEADLANQSADKVIKKFTTLGQLAPQMSNISSAIYSKQEKRRVTNIARTTHSTELYKDYYSEGKVDYNAARLAWKQQEAEKKKQVKLNQEITSFLQEYETFEKKLVDLKKKEVQSAEKIRKMTEYQQNKIKIANERNKINTERNSIRERERVDKRIKNDRVAGYQTYKSEHPELFAVGGLLHSPRYQTGRAFSGIGSAVSSLGTGGKILGGMFDALGTLIKSPVAGAATAVTNLARGVIDLGKSATQAFAEIEAIKTQLGVVFSNQTQADSMFGQISQYAVHSPFGVQQTSELAVLLKQSGVYASDLMDTLKMLGDTAGGNMEKMKRIANNYAQIVSIGKASMLDMRQFAYAGIPIFEAVSKELGVSQQELRKLISDGKVTSDIIEKVFKDLTGINGIFEKATEKGAKTLKARLQNLSDAKQLAFGSIGEWGVGLGNEYGNDSVGLNLVSSFEKFYNWLHDHVDTKNIERDVNTIANSDKRIQELEKMLQYAKDTGDKDAQKVIEAALKAQRSMFDPDVQRSIYSESFDAKTRKRDAGIAQFGYLSEYGVKDKIDVYALMRDAALERRSELNEKSKTDDLSSAELEELNQIRVQIEIYDQLIDDLESYRDGIREANTLTAEELKANREKNIINAQQLQYDQASKLAGKEGSYTSAFEKLYSAYTSSEEYKQKKEEEELKFLKEAQEVLKSLSNYLDSEGNLDMTKMSYSQFSSLYNDKHAFDPSRKLTVTEGKSELQMSEDRKLLTAQWEDMTKKITQELLDRRLYSIESEFSSVKNNYSLSGDNKQFFNNFDIILDKQLKVLEGLISRSTEEDKKYYQDMYNNLLASTIGFTVNDKGKNANLDEESKGKTKPDFIPLWKRIIEGATGFSAERITSSKQFMDEYQKYAAQQISRGGIQGLVSAGGMAGEVGTLLAYTGSKNKQGVHQVDWQKTEENLYNYALKLETPLQKASATMSGLASAMQNQIDVYKKLTADMYTVGEDWATINNDIKDQYSVAQGLGNQNILDNAFEAMSKASDKYKLSYDQEQGLVVYDKLGDKIVGSIEDLKKDTNISDAELSNFVKNINVDVLVSTIDKARKATETEAAILQANSDLLELANNLEKERIEKTAETFGKSSMVIGSLRSSGIVGGNLLSAGRSRNDYSLKAGQTVSETFAQFFKKVATVSNISDLKNDKDVKKIIGDNYALDALGGLQNTLKTGNIEDFSKAMEYFIKNFPEATKRIVEESYDTARSLRNNELMTVTDNLLTNSPLSISDAFNKYWRNSDNNLFEHNIMKSLGYQNVGFDVLSQYMTTMVKANPTENQALVDRYKKNILKASENEETGIIDEAESERLKELVSSGTLGEIEEFLDAIDREDIWENATEGANKWAISLGNVGIQLEQIMSQGGEIAEQWIKSSTTSTFSTWGEALGKGADASKELAANFRQLGASLLSNMGTMITEAGLSMAIHAKSKKDVLLGLAIAAAGGGLSFLGGYLNGKSEEDDKDNDEYQKLLKIKQDLTDLLRQAREDSIYYENTVRHKKALTANDNFVKSVHDAVITPRGDIVTTDPKDYLIATKTPRTLVGGGAPTINFSVIDKSTGVKVTQQRSSYDEASNTIEFEAIIESKIQEVIATSKGDEAFAARESRLSGKTVIA